MKFTRIVDRISEVTGAFSAWLVVPLMLVVIHEVIRRHIFNTPTQWGYDTCWMLFAAQFMIGGAFTLLRKGHIRIDIVYSVLSERAKLIYDTIIAIVIILPPMVLFTWAGTVFAADAWAYEFLLERGDDYPEYLYKAEKKGAGRLEMSGRVKEVV